MTEIVRAENEVQLWTPPRGIEPAHAGRVVCSFLDVATTAFGRATHYNTRQEQQAAELAIHTELLQLNRSLYAVMMALPGVTDRSVQVGLKNLLATSWSATDAFLNANQERELLNLLIQALPAPRMLKLIDALRVGNEQLGIRKANNARTRKLILRTLLGSPRLQLWSVKYRSKMQRAFVHAWGRKMASVIRQILLRDRRLWNAKEQGIVQANLLRFAGDQGAKAAECVRFIFGDRSRLSLPLLVAFEAAKTDLAAGKKLPLEVLQGIRGTFHPDVTKEQVLELAKDNLTKHQKIAVQRRAEEAGVKVDVDFKAYDAVKLYLYAFERGMNQEIADALEKRAARAAAALPNRWKSVGIVVDASKSMEGDRTQKLRPMAVTLALRDMLMAAAEHGVGHYCGGDYGQQNGLVRPMGDTAIADGLVQVLSHANPPEAVFVLSDGYENAPSGRFAEVLAQVRELGIDTPVYHLNPVMAAEASGVKELAPGDGVPTMPVQSPEALGATFIRGMIEAEPVKGINVLIRKALEAGPSGQAKKALPRKEG